MTITIHKRYHDKLDLITLTNGSLKATFLNFGARLYQLFTPDQSGNVENILLSLDDKLAILNDQAFFGAFVGPVAGRIKHANWQNIHLEKNNGCHHIHGGSNGWAFQYWDYETYQTENSVGISFTLFDTFSGYPGPITAIVNYELTEDSLLMKSIYQTEKTTLINPTNHAYFNLSGNSKSDITTHTLQIAAAERIVTDKENIPTGARTAVSGTPYDFTKEKQIASALTDLPTGIDDSFILNADSSAPQLLLSDSVSGRRMAITTNRQSVVVFTATGFNDAFLVNGQPMRSNLGIALETQELPDIVHHPEWGSIEFTPETKKEHWTRFTFSTEDS
ncbi:aldose epimerase family protein [Enterococcus sp. BWR-S5]|uniref:aldose epimerase family protein n=1 Tax=Enterococcus sp. BWR-S5 TaxID=2787714 RepID=UPI001922BD35|nr:aldose epimerase family protein [Enterococcus sp. BWR-S5]MBL1225578.1 galactose mutarotase [Enterococcus sp. BWR-S5]